MRLSSYIEIIFVQGVIFLPLKRSGKVMDEPRGIRSDARRSTKCTRHDNEELFSIGKNALVVELGNTTESPSGGILDGNALVLIRSK